MTSRRSIPSIERLLEQPTLVDLAIRVGRDTVADAARRSADGLRRLMAEGAAAVPHSDDEVVAWLEHRVAVDLEGRLAPSLRRTINATGVILHTNLGRAPLAQDAVDRIARVASGYSNLEYDLAAGTRGRRHVHAERLLTHLSGAPAALVANNNAAAMLVVLAALASGREVIVSRGELVEIGGGFRVPDILAQSGATLREVGTTNRTRVADYAAAINDRTALLLRVHPSNFRIDGFTERPTVEDLAGLARRFSIPLVEDLGSGWLGVEAALDRPPALEAEPSVAASLRSGADLVAFSGDKLLGGPQAGIVVGRSDLIERVGKHPLMRAVRADKLQYAALEATLALWTRPADRTRIPVYRMLTMGLDEIDRRAAALASAFMAMPGVASAVIDGLSTSGGGSAPGATLPTRLVTVAVDGLSAAALDARLRAAEQPIVARIHDDTVVLDPRTVHEDDDAQLIAAVETVDT